MASDIPASEKAQSAQQSDEHTNESASGSAAEQTPGQTADQPAHQTADQRRDEIALRLVDRFSVWSGAAGLIPLPFIDIATVGEIQLQMLRKLAALYGVRSGAPGKVGARCLNRSDHPGQQRHWDGERAKGRAPRGNNGRGDFNAGFVGWRDIRDRGRVFIQHFASGGTLLDFNPPDYREFIKEQTQKLKSKLDAAPPSQQTATRGSDGQHPAASGN